MYRGYKDGRFDHARRIVRTEKFRDDDESDNREIVNAGFPIYNSPLDVHASSMNAKIHSES